MGGFPGDCPRMALSALDGLSSLFSLIWLLICVVAVAVLAYLFTRFLAGRGGGMVGLSGGGEGFKVLRRLSLGREHSAVLVKAGERYLLLGVAPSGITLLAEFTAEEAEAITAPPPGSEPPPSFGEALRTVLKQKKPR